MPFEEDNRLQKVVLAYSNGEGVSGHVETFEGKDVTFTRNEDGSLTVKCIEYGTHTGHMVVAAGMWHSVYFYRERDLAIEMPEFGKSFKR